MAAQQISLMIHHLKHAVGGQAHKIFTKDMAIFKLNDAMISSLSQSTRSWKVRELQLMCCTAAKPAVIAGA